MTSSPATLTVQVKLVPNTHVKFDHKIVFIDLESQLAALGLRIVCAESRENGSGTPVATRVSINTLKR